MAHTSCKNQSKQVLKGLCGDLGKLAQAKKKFSINHAKDLHVFSLREENV
jgi:hypothetical protein